MFFQNFSRVHFDRQGIDDRLARAEKRLMRPDDFLEILDRHGVENRIRGQSFLAGPGSFQPRRELNSAETSRRRIKDKDPEIRGQKAGESFTEAAEADDRDSFHLYKF